jgi:5'-nucleotidase
MHGTLLSDAFEGAPIRELFSLMSYDAVAVGNHEFDYGPRGDPRTSADRSDDPRGALMAWIRAAPFPVLSANIQAAHAASGAVEPFAGHAILVRAGIRIGIIGLTTPKTATSTMRQHLSGLRVLPLLDSAQRLARDLRKQGIGVIILLAHAGGFCPHQDPRRCRGEIFESLLDKIDPALVDAVVTGHTHKPIWLSYRAIPVIQACRRGIAVGRLEIQVDRRTGLAVRGLGRALPPLPVCHEVYQRTGTCTEGQRGDGLRPNPLLEKHRGLAAEVRGLVAKYEEKIDARAGRIIAWSDHPIKRDRYGVRGPGALFAQALLLALPGADAALVNPGSIRADLPAGAITYGHLYRAFPFENQLTEVKLTGAELRTLLERILQRQRGIPKVAGFKLRLRCAGSFKIDGIADAAGAPIADHRLYTLVIDDFLLSGGDGLGGFFGGVPSARKRIHAGRMIRELLAELLGRILPPPGTHPRPPPSPAVGGAVILDRARCRPPQYHSDPSCR